MWRAAANTAERSASPRGPERRAYGNHHQIGNRHRVGVIGREAEVPTGHGPVKHVFEAGFVNRNRAGAQESDLGFVDVDDCNLVTQVGQTSRGHEADVARSGNGDSHAGVPSVTQR